MNIRKDDTVMVIAGDDAGKTGRVLSLHPKEGRIVVEGVNRVYKHLKPNRRNQQGGRLSKEMPIDISLDRTVVEFEVSDRAVAVTSRQFRAVNPLRLC